MLNCNRGKEKTDKYCEEMEAIERGRGRGFQRMYEKEIIYGASKI